MKTPHRMKLLVLGCVLLVTTSAPGPVSGRPLYKKVFDQVYPLKDWKTSCEICHPVGHVKSELNDYGMALKKELGESKVSDEKRIAEALRAIGKPKGFPGASSDLQAVRTGQHDESPEAGDFTRAGGWGSVRQIVAHRGSSTDCPENTLASTRRAIEAGATAVEVDVRTTQDGHLVLLHDATLDRTTSGRGPLAGHTLAQVRTLDAGSHFDPRFRDERVPTLIEVLDVCRGRIDVLLDLKESGERYDRQVAGTIRSAFDPRRTIVGVRSVEQARRFRELLPEARQLGLIASPADIEPYARAGVEMIRLWPKWLVDPELNGPELIARVRKAGCTLHLNGTDGTPAETAPLVAYRPESISSDDPARLIVTLQKLHRAARRAD